MRRSVRERRTELTWVKKPAGLPQRGRAGEPTRHGLGGSATRSSPFFGAASQERTAGAGGRWRVGHASTEKPVDKWRARDAYLRKLPLVHRPPVHLSTRPPVSDLYFPPRELAVMSVLWRLGSATVTEVRTRSRTTWRTRPSSRRCRRSRRRATCATRRRVARIATSPPSKPNAPAAARSPESATRSSTARPSACSRKWCPTRSSSRKELERMRTLIAKRLGGSGGGEK